jgi:hypothetical protein
LAGAGLAIEGRIKVPVTERRVRRNVAFIVMGSEESNVQDPTALISYQSSEFRITTSSFFGYGMHSSSP